MGVPFHRESLEIQIETNTGSRLRSGRSSNPSVLFSCTNAYRMKSLCRVFGYPLPICLISPVRKFRMVLMLKIIFVPLFSPAAADSINIICDPRGIILVGPEVSSLWAQKHQSCWPRNIIPVCPEASYGFRSTWASSALNPVTDHLIPGYESILELLRSSDE